MTKEKEDSNAAAWKKLFEKYNIIEEVDKHGYFKIKAEAIKEFREPRLMTKFDEYSAMPKLFRDKGLSILSDSRGTYLIGRFSLFAKINYKIDDVRPFEPTCLESLTIDNLNNESSSILFAFNSNILKESFETDDISFSSYGRMGAGNFSYRIDLVDSKRLPIGKNKNIEAKNPQIEIDGAFETEDSLYIVEATNRFVEDMNLRQLYYPYKLWSSRIGKKIIPVFLVFSDKTFYIYICSFDDPDNINSIRVVKSIKYESRDEPITLQDVVRTFEEAKPTAAQHSNIFPQADRMEKIIDLLNILEMNEETTKKDVTEYFKFDSRQTDYYLNAAAFLGLVSIVKRKGFGLSAFGKGLMKKQYRERNLAIIKSILNDQVFYQSFKFLLDNREMPSKEYISELINRYYPPKKNGKVTAGRRSQTVISWLNWMIDLTSP